MTRLWRSRRSPSGLHGGFGGDDTGSTTREAPALAIAVEDGASTPPSSRPAERDEGERGRDVSQLTDRDLRPWPGDRRRAVIAGAIVIAALVGIAASLPGLWVLAGTAVMALSLTWRRGTDYRRNVTILCGITVALTAVDYLSWRAVVANWAGWAIAAPLLAAEIFGALHTLGLQYTIWPSARPRLVGSEDPRPRPIYVLVPTVNEGAAVLRPTIQGALEARQRYLAAFPDGRVTIVVCNDARVAGVKDWTEVEELAQQLGVTCVTRTVSGGNKAGNLEHARQQVRATGDALVAIFDADQVANPDFLVKTVPPFADRSVGWVQTGQYYGNLQQPVARWANDQQALFYRLLCPGKAAQNAAFICGTNVVIRAAALDEIGGLPQDSVTEDFAASIQLHARWRSVYLSDVLAVGLGPMDLPAFLKQQRRWAIGTMGVLRSHWRAILIPRRGGLCFEQRIQYALACTHYMCGLRDLVYIVSPLAFLVTGVPAVRGATLGEFLWHFLPYWVASQTAFWVAARRQTGLRGVIMGFGSFPVLIRALVAVALGRRAGFMVTSKRRRSGRSWRHLTVYVVALSACFVGILLPLGQKQLRTESVAISVLWVVYDIGLLASFLWLGILDLRSNDAVVSRPRTARPEKNGRHPGGRLVPNFPGISVSSRRLRSALLMPFLSFPASVRRGLAICGALVLACACAAAMLTFGERVARAGPIVNSTLWLVYELALLTTLVWVVTSQPRFAGAALDPRRIVQAVRDRAGSGRGAGRSLKEFRGALRRPTAPISLPERLSPSRRALPPALGALTVVLLAAVIPRLSPAPAPENLRLAASRGADQAPNLGLSLAHDILTTRPSALQARLCLSFAVIGRTQDINDSLDITWANRLSSQHQQPWISLQFGNFTADGKVPLSASLPAIRNGVHDTNIRRWAEEIHAYGKPIYLTILLHVDRNWSMSSAAANGGIPQDAPRAWQHVRSIFDSVGDTNVAWVWSPADPAHDQAYAPPESTIDVVLQSMIRYPNTPWPDPAAVLRAVSERHPTKPFFLEVSADGPPAEKAAWLERVSSAVAAERQVRTLLYHEGAPDIHAIAAENAIWSVESDVNSIGAMSSWRALAGAAGGRCQSSSLAKSPVG
ncbi:MAG: hypothetical protein DLM67_22390 [Candidatus Nephthysia bennettiae]|uniref:Glycosyltransferase n=1 Tax=Candidatus Nephthysia bennettiae TaxID=3127016 RepID=A0A934K239_9BACT|nr:glycosyltransferase [Candidatus Dormibacteraeota bacterium]PZR87314.1 MAG: hypothetical protein DLM67_22390 [Candidatus Dormibacteraeota bacterium]